MKFSILQRIGLALVWGAFFLSACGGAQTITPPPETPDAPTRQAIVFPTAAPGWSIYSRATYQLALPDTWQEIKLQETELQNAITRAQTNNPPLAEQLRALLESGQYKTISLYAIENNRASITPNVTLTRFALSPNQTLESLVKAYAEALPNTVRGAQVRQVQIPLQINGIRAAALEYDVALVDATSQVTTLRGVQYLYVLDSGDAYALTLTANAADAEKFLPLAKQIANSFAANAR